MIQPDDGSYRPSRGGRRRGLWAAAAATVLLAFGVVLVSLALTGQHSPPRPTQVAGPPSPAETTSAGATTENFVLPASTPTAISLPSIGVYSPLITAGQNPDGTLQVPQPGSNYDKAAWYRYSPTPGEIGPSVIEGHVDSAVNGPSVFFRLGDLHPGDSIAVTRADHSIATFRVDRIGQYPKDAFPTSSVYGNTVNAQLRLITCGGAFDSAARSYVDNIVVYASLLPG